MSAERRAVPLYHSASAQALLDSCRVEYRYILRDTAGRELTKPRPGEVAQFCEPGAGPALEFPSYMAALRGRALRGLPHEIHIIQQESQQ